MSNESFTIGERLREERERLGYTQTGFAAAAETTKQSQIAYEKGRSQPAAAYLRAIAGVGADVDYILTGMTREYRERQQVLRLVSQSVSGLGLPEGVALWVRDLVYAACVGDNALLADILGRPGVAPIGADEAELLAVYRSAPPPARAAIRAAAAAFAQQLGAGKNP